MTYRMPWAQKRTQKQAAIQEGWKSGLEEAIGDQLRARGIDPRYEELVIQYQQPPRTARYTPDFQLPNGIIIESKGRFMPKDRAKHILVKKQLPHLDIRFVFSNPKQLLYKSTEEKPCTTSYGSWCEKHGFQYATKLVPEAWLLEKPRNISPQKSTAKPKD